MSTAAQRTQPGPSEAVDPIELTSLDAAGLDHDALAAAYRRSGVVQVRGLLDPAEVAALRDTFTEHMASGAGSGHDDGVHAGDPLHTWPRMVQPHREDHPAGRLARRWLLAERVTDLVRAAVGPVWAAQSMFYFKPPGARGQAMHQDNLFLQSHPETCVAAWIAVDDCGPDNGALAVVPGTHRYELVCPEEADIEESFTTVQVRVPDHMALAQTRMRAGDCLVFHGSLVHGSKPNTTADRFRRSLIFHYVPEGSQEIAHFYQPLLTTGGAEVTIGESADGGACGEGWTPVGHH